MFALLDSYIEPADSGDISLAWDRAMAGNALVIVPTPGATYVAQSTLVVSRRVLVLSWAATFWIAASTCFRVTSGGARSAFVGVSAESNRQGGLGAHGWDFQARAYALLCRAEKFAGDGFHVEADVTSGTNANSGALLWCDSVSHLGRAYSWRGGDSNAWTVIGCTTSNCVGDWLTTSGQPGAPRVAGYHDQSFLGTRIIACQSGAHVSNDGVAPIGYCLDGNSGAGVIAFSYQEGGPLGPKVCVRHSNIAIGNLCGYTDDSDGLRIGGPKILGRLVFGGAGVIASTLTIGAPTDGSIGEIKSALDGYGYSLTRTPNVGSVGYWEIRRANSSAQTVLALRADKAGILAPLGLSLGSGNAVRLVNVAKYAPAAASGVVGDVTLASEPTATLDGWRKVGGPNGPYWRPFAWGAGN